MANEYLKRTPTSSGNRKKWTWAGWVKINKDFGSSNYNTVWSVAAGVSSNNSDRFHLYHYSDGRWVTTGTSSFSAVFTGPGGSAAHSRDPGAWMHICLSCDTTISSSTPDNIQRFWVNGVEYNYDDAGNIADNADLAINGPYEHYIGTRNSSVQRSYDGQMFDLYLVDGQALTPDVFGFYKDGDGYMSSGTTQATDFRPGQWMPHAPRKIKSDIERRGGFGVNGFYLPMNSSNNPGADFHCTPDTILKLKENLPQPKAEIDYTGALRDDPLKDFLVLAVPGVLGGKQNGYGDYSGDIKGSGNNKILTANGNATVAATASYYGSALSFDGTGDSFVIPQSTDFDFGTGSFTVECWVYLKANNANIIHGETTSSGNFGFILFPSGTNSFFYGVGLGSIQFDLPIHLNQWTHIACVRDGSTDFTVFVNGVAGGYSTSFNKNFVTSAGVRIGLHGDGSTHPLNGYIQDLRVYNGVAKYKGGFDVPKPYTPVGIEAFRTTADTCKNNFATWNPLLGPAITPMADGNLSVTNNGVHKGTRSTIGVTSGKWYWEYRVGSVVVNSYVGVSNRMGADGLTGGGDYILHGTGGNNYALPSGSFSVTNAAFTTGMIIGCAFDYDAGTLDIYKDGTLAVQVTGGSFGGLSYHAHNSFNASFTDEWVGNFGQNPSFNGKVTAGTNTDSNGKGLFKYAPPSGFLALCEDNLPTPAIADPGKYFKTVLWSGSGSNRGITGVGFQPDFVWVKRRDGSAVRHYLFDSVRGPLAGLDSADTIAEVSSSTWLQSFDSNGFSLGTSGGLNGSGNNYVAWCWKAGGAAVANNDGSIASQVSANQTAGFSVVSWTGNGSNGATLGHGLGKRPSWVLVKDRDNSKAWYVWVDDLTGSTVNNGMTLNTTAAVAGFGHGHFTSLNNSTMTLTQGGSSLNNHNQNNIDYIAYCWAEIEGFSKFGSYVGNGNADGSFVYCGFKPAFVMLKASSATGNWCMIDNARNSTNPTNFFAVANSSNAGDDTGGALDFLSNGFKLRLTSPNFNGSGTTYIFAAFAESPFQTANAK